MRFKQYLAAIAWAVAMALGIGVAGEFLGPTWDPAPYTQPIVPQVDSTAIGGDIATAPVGTYDVEERHETIEISGHTLDVLVRTPVGLSDSLTAVVFLHGVGTFDTTGFERQAAALASAGIVTVVAEKPVEDYSIFHRDYQHNAQDYSEIVDYAYALPGVTSVGLYGESEGAYIAPILATDRSDIDFLVLVSPPVVPPRQQAAFAVNNYLDSTGVPDEVYRLIPRALGGQWPLGFATYADFNVAPYQQQLTIPILGIFGTADYSIPMEQAAAQIIADAQVAGNPDVTIRFYEGANHGIRIDDGSRRLIPHFADDLARWINGLPVTAHAEPQIAGGQPTQEIWASPPPQPPFFLQGNWVVVTHVLPVLFILTALGMGIGAAVRAIRRRTLNRRAVLVASLLTTAMIAAIGTWVMWIRYVIDIGRLASSYSQNPDISFGGYTAENTMAVIAGALLGIATYASLLHGRGRPSQLTLWAMRLGCIGTFGFLLLASYWAGFPNFGIGS